jgi:hypothetical protein
MDEARTLLAKETSRFDLLKARFCVYSTGARMNLARRVAFISLFGALCCGGLAQKGYQVKTS